MAEKRVYAHIRFDLNEDKISFDHGPFESIGKYILDFIYFDFTSEKNGSNKEIELHPYLKRISPNQIPISKIVKIQNIYKSYFQSMVAEDGVQTEDSMTYLRKVGCVAAMKIVNEDGHLYAEYMVADFEECLFVEWFEMTRRRLHVKLCKNCHRFFVPKKGNIDYCHRIYTEDGKICAQVGYAQTFAKSVKSDELLQAYTRAYKAHYARMTKPRKRAANMTKEEFETWYAQAKEYLNLARQGKINTAEYLEWLKK